MKTGENINLPPKSPKIPNSENDKPNMLLVIFGGLFIAIVIVISTYVAWKEFTAPKDQGQNIIENQSQEEILENSTKGTLPSVSNNILENKPDVNPLEKLNPINNIKVNPFE